MRKKSSGIPIEISNSLDLLTKELEEIGIAYAGHGIVSVRGNHTGYIANRQWQEIYYKHQFFSQKDTVLDAFIQCPFHAVYWNHIEDCDFTQARREVVGIVSGLTLSSFYDSYFCFFNIGFNDDRDSEKFIKEYQPLLAAYHKRFDETHLAWRTLQKELHFDGGPSGQGNILSSPQSLIVPK